MLVELVFLRFMEASCSLGCGCPVIAPPHDSSRRLKVTAKTVQRPGPDTEGWQGGSAEPRLETGWQAALDSRESARQGPGKQETWGKQEMGPQTQALSREGEEATFLFRAQRHHTTLTLRSLYPVPGTTFTENPRA